MTDSDGFDYRNNTFPGFVGLDVFGGHPHVAVYPFAEHRPRIGADQLGGAQGVIVLTPSPPHPHTLSRRSRSRR